MTNDMDGDLRSFTFDLFKQRYSRCLARDDCDDPPIQAHSMQRARALERIAQDGHVLQFAPNITAKGPLVALKKLGLRQASTFPGLCAAHDATLFRPIDTAEIEPTNMEQLFLLAYRSTVKELHACLEAGSRVQAGYQKLVDVGRAPGDRPSPAGMAAVERMMVAYDTHLYKTRLDEALQHRRYTELEHAVAVYSGLRPTIAVSTMFWVTGDTASGDPPRVILNVVPQDGHVLVVFSAHQDEAPAMRGWLQEWLRASEHYQRYLLSKIIIDKSENFFLAPAFYEALPKERRDVIEAYFCRTLLKDEPGYDHSGLYLFDDV